MPTAHTTRPLFDEMERTDLGFRDHATSVYDHLNHSARPACARIRDRLADWFSAFPPDARAELRGRFVKDNLDSAFHELLLHAALRGLGMDVARIPHDDRHGERTPDYGLLAPDGSRSYVEAVVASDESVRERRQANVLNRLYDEINKLRPQGFAVSISEVAWDGDVQPSAREIKHGLVDWLSKLDPDVPVYDRRLRRFRYRSPGFVIVFRPVALRAESRGDPRLKMLAAPPSRAFWGGSEGPIVGAVRSKASRYGRLKAPYVIAVNALAAMGTRRLDMETAAYGEWMTLTDREGQGRSRAGCSPGLFTGTGHTRVSAIFVTTAQPWNLAEADAALLHNPNAEFPYEGVLCAFPQARLHGSTVEWQEGVRLRDVLGIPPGWPE